MSFPPMFYFVVKKQAFNKANWKILRISESEKVNTVYPYYTAYEAYFKINVK